MGKEFPLHRYQCVSMPGRCKFEWCCGPECSCRIINPKGGMQERIDTKAALTIQDKWRKRWQKRAGYKFKED